MSGTKASFVEVCSHEADKLMAANNVQGKTAQEFIDSMSNYELLSFISYVLRLPVP